MIFVKRIFAADIRLRLRSLLRFFVKRALILNMSIKDKQYVLIINMYGPNKDSLNSFEKNKQDLKQYNDRICIDWLEITCVYPCHGQRP